MINLTNLDGNVRLEFDFLNNLPEDFDITKSKFEKWVQFVLKLSTLGRNIAINEDMHACMTFYEIEKIYNGLKDLFHNIGDKKNRIFTHYSSESFFEISIEYLDIDECFNVELWFIIAECPDGKIDGYDVGFRFIVDKCEMEKFVEEFYNSFKRVCPQCVI